MSNSPVSGWRGFLIVPLAWLLLALVWVVTYFVGLPESEALWWPFVAFTFALPIYALVTAIMHRKVLLGICALITPFCWFIMFFIAVGLFGFSSEGGLVDRILE